MIENHKKDAHEPKKSRSQLEEWQVDAGINEILLETPVNRLDRILIEHITRV